MPWSRDRGWTRACALRWPCIFNRSKSLLSTVVSSLVSQGPRFTALHAEASSCTHSSMLSLLHPRGTSWLYSPLSPLHPDASGTGRGLWHDFDTAFRDLDALQSILLQKMAPELLQEGKEADETGDDRETVTGDVADGEAATASPGSDGAATPPEGGQGQQAVKKVTSALHILRCRRQVPKHAAPRATFEVRCTKC